MMEQKHFINLVILLIVNVLFTFPGICLNSLVILSFWRSAQLRKKLCYFMIMVLSCCDLLAVLTNHPMLALTAMFWLTEKFDMLRWLYSYLDVTNIFLGFSLLALLVMNFDRYLATSYPIFHRTSVTKKRLLTLFALLIIGITLLLSFLLGFGISIQVFVLISFVILFPPMLSINFKLFTTARKSHRNNKISLKNVSSCLLTAACFVVLCIPAFVYIGRSLNTEGSWALDDVDVSGLWSKTIASMNCTFNCLIFYWKNKILRKEGFRIINSLKVCPKVYPRASGTKEPRL